MATPQDNGAELMSAYLDDALEPGEAEAVEQMLAASPEAREELEDLRKLVQLVAGLGAVEAPRDFYEKLSRKLKRRQAFDGNQGLLAVLTMPFQVVCIIVILTVAAMYMMAQLEAAPQSIERDPSAATSPADGEESLDPDAAPRPVVP